MTCARCGCGVFKAEDQIIMNKVWHKCCFRCSRCNKVLDKCSAKLFQGEIFCECCHGIVLEDFETLIKPCRVVSSPSCICIKRESQYITKTPSFDYCKKYDICFPSELKDDLTRNIQSCSCIPDVKNKAYCFAFPIPREVANYYNRSGMRKRSRYLSQKRHSNDDKHHCPKRNLDPHPNIRIRNLSPSRKRGSPIRGRSPIEDSPPGSPQRCCCCPKYKCCSCNKRSECPRSSCCPCPRQNSAPCSSCRGCRDCRGCRCKEFDVKPRSSSPRRRYYSPHKKSPCRCCRAESPERSERPEPSQHIPRPHQQEYSYKNEYPHKKEYPQNVERPHYQDHQLLPDDPHNLDRPHYSENPQHLDRPYYPENFIHSERPHHPESPAHLQDYSCYKECQCCKECPRNCKRNPHNQCSCCPYSTETYSCRYEKHGKHCRCDKPKKLCVCGKPNPCDCKMNQIRSECTSVCVRCGCKVYAAEKICVSGGPYHTSCFSCVCCHKLLDVKNVYENAGEIYCKHCYNNSLGNSYYGYS